MIRRHSATELVDRAVAAGLVERHQHRPTPVRSGFAPPRTGPAASPRLAAVCLEERKLLAPWLQALWDGLDGAIDADGPVDVEQPSPSSPDRRSSSILSRRVGWDGWPNRHGGRALPE
jgi:hypothetical protein